MNIPQQLLPLSKKGEDFIKKSALAFASIARGTGQSKRNDEIAWDYYNGKIDPKKFKYLTEVGDFALPAKLRHISIQRPPINLLASQQSRRPFVFSVVAIDEESVKEKFKNQFVYVIKQLQLKVKEQQAVFQVGYKKLQQQRQMIEQQLQREPQSEEELQQMQALQAQLPEIETAMGQMQEEFEERLKLGKEELEKIQDYLTYDYKELKEMLAQKSMKKIRQTHRLKEHSVSFFVDKIVTGKGFFLVDYDVANKKLIYESLDSMRVHYPSIEGVKYVQEGPWVVVEDWISFSNVIDMYGDAKELNDDVMKELEYYKEYSAGDEVGQPNANVYTGARTYSNGINRKRIWWKSPRKVFVKYSPNKHKEGEFFRHFINDETKFDVKPNVQKGEQVKTLYIYDLFTATIIDDKYIVDGRRIENPLRKKDELTPVELPVLGRSYSSYAEEPYSLIWNTKDIQDLYNIVNYHRELYIAASGVKGQIVDLSQKPGNMSIQEQRYHKKTGTLYIQTVDKAGRKTQSPYNQWKDYDDTVSPAIQYLEAILLSLDNACKETMGVTRQRMGQIVNSDQVGTSELSRDQSALITEIIFFEADQIEAMALRRAVNLLAKHQWKDESMLQFTNPDLSTEVVKIPANLLNKGYYDVHVLNNTNEERNMEEIKMLAHRQHEKGMIPFKNIVQMYNKSSVVELQKAVIRWSEEAEKIQQMNMQNQVQAEQEAIKLKAQVENEMKMLVEKDKNELERMRIEIQQAQLELERNNNQITAMLKEKEIETNKEVELLKILSNREVETKYLGEQMRNNQAQEQLQLLQLKLSQMQMRIDAELGQEQVDIKDKEVKTKEKIEKTKMRDKNAIRN